MQILAEGTGKKKKMVRRATCEVGGKGKGEEIGSILGGGKARDDFLTRYEERAFGRL